MKTCERCGSGYSRNPRYSTSQWEAQRFCSLACSTPQHGMCRVDACERTARGDHGLCNLHRQRLQKTGRVDDPRPGLLARVMARIRRGDCWEWTGSVSKQTGYGQLWADGTTRLAHRVVYELLVGPIPAGLELDHLCRNRSCVNPAHLEPVTTAENLRRMRVALKGAQ